MIKFRDVKVDGNKLILSSPVSQEEFTKIARDWYGSRIPIYKPVGMFMTHGVTLNGANDMHYDDIRVYDFISRISDYVPILPKKMAGAYEKQGTAIDFDISIKEREAFRNKAFVHGRHSTEVSTIAPFTNAVNMDNVIQVFARVHKEDLKCDSDWLKPDENRGDIYHNYIEMHYASEKLGGIYLPERLSVDYSKFLYYGYDTWQLSHKEHPMCLVDKSVEILFKSGDGRSRLRTPVIVCYKGTGEMTAAKIINTLFDEPVQEFIPFEHVRFNIANYVNLNMGAFVPGTNVIPLIYLKDVNTEALQIILQNYGEDE